MKIHRFTFEAERLREFVDFPWTIYADDPRWIPPSREEVRRLLAPENPFFRYGEALNLLVTEGRPNTWAMQCDGQSETEAVRVEPGTRLASSRWSIVTRFPRRS